MDDTVNTNLIVDESIRLQQIEENKQLSYDDEDYDNSADQQNSDYVDEESEETLSQKSTRQNKQAMEDEQNNFGYGNNLGANTDAERIGIHEVNQAGNIFTRKRETTHDRSSELITIPNSSIASLDLQAELKFEECCVTLLAQKKWEQLLYYTESHLSKKNTSQYRAFFYRGVANYKLTNYEEACEDFNHALNIIQDRESLYPTTEEYNRRTVDDVDP